MRPLMAATNVNWWRGKRHKMRAIYLNLVR